MQLSGIDPNVENHFVENKAENIDHFVELIRLGYVRSILSQLILNICLGKMLKFIICMSFRISTNWSFDVVTPSPTILVKSG
jgi:hypothetical protein